MLKPLSAISVPLRSSLVGSTAGAVPRVPEGFGPLLIAARQAVKAAMPQSGGKSEAPTSLAGGAAALSADPMAESMAAPASGRLGRELGLARDRANSDESVQAKQTQGPPAVVPAPPDPVPALPLQPDPQIAAVFVQAAGLAGQAARVPLDAGGASPQSDVPSARPGAGSGVQSLPPSPALGVADTVSPAALSHSSPQQATPNSSSGEQPQDSSVTPPDGNGQHNAALGTTQRLAAAAGSPVLSDASGPLGGPSAASGAASAGPAQDKSAAGIAPQSVVAAAANAPIFVAAPTILSSTSHPLGQSAVPSVSPAQGKLATGVIPEPAVTPRTNTSAIVAAPAVLSNTLDPLGRSPAMSGAPATGPAQNKPVAGIAPQPAVVVATSLPALAASTPSVLSAQPGPISGTRPWVPSGVTGTDVAALRAPTSPALADTLQSMIGVGIEGMALSKGSGRAVPGLPVGPESIATDLTPVLSAATDAPDAGPRLVDLDAHSLSAGADLAGANLYGDVVSPIVRQPAREAASVQMKGETGIQAADPQIVPGQTNDMQTTPASGVDSLRSLPAHSGSAPSVADQVAPAVVSMAQNHGDGGRLSISITPDQLGQVHITVERATDGTTTIHVAAEQLATLDLLRQDQGSLHRALDQAGVGQEGHRLSFSWDGSGGGMPGWGSPSHQRGDNLPTEVNLHAEETVSTPAVVAAARGGIDVTA